MTYLSDRDERTLEGLRRHHHREIAVTAALHYVSSNKLSAPEWLTREAAIVMAGLISGKRAPGRGRAGGFVRRYEQDQIDYTRYDRVLEVRRVQLEKEQQLRELQETDPQTKQTQNYIDELKKHIEWFGHTLQRAFECASMDLAETPSFGSPDAIKRSYNIVRKNNKKIDAEGMRYHIIDHKLERYLGVRAVHADIPRQGRKFVLFTDLTLPGG